MVSFEYKIKYKFKLIKVVIKLIPVLLYRFSSLYLVIYKLPPKTKLLFLLINLQLKQYATLLEAYKASRNCRFEEERFVHVAMNSSIIDPAPYKALIKIKGHEEANRVLFALGLF